MIWADSSLVFSQKSIISSIKRYNVHSDESHSCCFHKVCYHEAMSSSLTSHLIITMSSSSGHVHSTQAQRDVFCILSHVCKTRALISVGGSRGLLSLKFFATGKESMKDVSLVHRGSSVAVSLQDLVEKFLRRRQGKKKASIDLQQLISCSQLISTLWAGNVKYSLPRIQSGSFIEWLSPERQ